MKKLLLISLLVLVLSLAAFTPAQADHTPAQGLCKDGFELHHVHEHTEHGHHHIGTDADRNGDGYICAKHATSDNHVHIDNSIPIQ